MTKENEPKPVYEMTEEEYDNLAKKEVEKKKEIEKQEEESNPNRVYEMTEEEYDELEKDKLEKSKQIEIEKEKNDPEDIYEMTEEQYDRYLKKEAEKKKEVVQSVEQSEVINNQQEKIQKKKTENLEEKSKIEKSEETGIKIDNKDKLIEVAIKNFGVLSERKKVLLAEKKKWGGLVYKLGIKKKDPEVEKEYRLVYSDYDEKLGELEKLTGKSKEAIMREFSKGEKENNKDVREVNERLDSYEKDLLKREQAQSKEKKDLFEKIGIKDKRAKLLIMAAVAGGMVAFPVGGIAAGAFGLGLGQALGIGTWISYQTATGLVIGNATFAIGGIGGGGALLHKIMKEARELGQEKKSTSQNNKKEEVKEDVFSLEFYDLEEKQSTKESAIEEIKNNDVEQINEKVESVKEETLTFEIEDHEVDFIKQEKEGEGESLVFKINNKISEVRDFSELYEMLSKLKYSKEVIEKIKSLEDLKYQSDSLISELNKIDYKNGLREKVKELINKKIKEEKDASTIDWVN
ncbi:MAG: hypothetical protein WC319_05835 [Candidatus Paceibacterota bacterium]|jgi:hypothetical protein